jgi:hypothetical protein
MKSKKFNVRESLPYIVFLYEDTPEIKEENHRRYEAAVAEYKQKKLDGYTPTLYGYILKENK